MAIVIMMVIMMSLGDGCSDNNSVNDSDNVVNMRWLS